MVKRKNVEKAGQISLDLVSEKRGPKPKFLPGEVSGRASNNHGFLENIWDRFWPGLSAAETEDDVIRAFREAYDGFSDLVPARAGLILEVKKERSFPKGRTARIRFMADSLGGLGVVSARRSRDICAEERAEAKRAHKILRCEYYIECSCGYTGPSHDKACRWCHTIIPEWLAPATITDIL
jgi:hypothetical protein